MSRLRAKIFVAIWALWVVSPLLGGEAGNVWVLNSDASVSKYAAISSAFQAKLKGKIHEIDLGRKFHNESWVQYKLAKEQPALIFCIGTSAYLQARKYAKNTPLIFALGLRWRRMSLTENTYVLASDIPPAHNLLMFSFFFPEIKKIGVPYGKQQNKTWFQKVEKEAQVIGLEIIGLPLSRKSNIKSLFTARFSEFDALWLTADPEVLSGKTRVATIFKLSDAYKKPIFAYSPVFAKFGAAFIVAPDVRTMGGQAAGFAKNIQAQRAMEEKIEYPAGTFLAINLKKLQQYGVIVNQRALSTVNEYIE